MKKQTSDEKLALLSNERKSYDQKHHQSSYLEWAESSWTRFLHVLCWLWINPILSLAYKRQLTENDLDDTPYTDKASVLLNRLDSYDWLSLPTWKIITKEFWKDYISASLFFVLYFITCVGQPLILRQFIFSIINKQESNTLSYLYSVLLLVSVVIQSIAERQGTFGSIRVGVRIRNALTIAIYKRSLSLKSASWERMSTGQIINIIANDTFKFEQVYAYLAGLCGSLVEVNIIFGLLCWIINPISALCGYAVLILLLLALFSVNKKFFECRQITAIHSDKRIQAFREFIQGCHIVKMYNWEKPIGEHIRDIRENELSSIRRALHLRVLHTTRYFITSKLLALTIFGSAWYLDYPLNVANIFPALLYFFYISNNLMYYLPMIIGHLTDMTVASKRIDSFMHLCMKPEHHSPLPTSSTNQQQNGSIVMSMASFAWHNGIPCLSSIDLTINQGTFIGIVGPVGSGKSSLLNAILGELILLNGQLYTNDSSFSYAAQLPWIFTDTFRNNILLSQPIDELRYRNVIYACCLDVDISQLGISGDLTIIGENGVNLSGGQKARVALARALYADADIYLLDDPLAAVDRKVAKQIYERCIGPRGLLKNKTRLFVTHQSQFLDECNQIIYLLDGHIDKPVCFTKSDHIIKDDIDKKETSILADLLDQNASMTDIQPIIEEEKSSGDGTRWHLLYSFFTASPLGTCGCYLLIALFLIGEVLLDGTNYWLSLLLRQVQINEVSPKFVYIFFGLVIAAIVAEIIRSTYYFSVVSYGSNRLHNNMLRGLLYTSIQFFESNPSGRILNRVSKDQYTIDELFPIIMLYGVKSVLTVAGLIFFICFINVFLIMFILLLLPVIWLIIRFYHKTSDQLQRLESIIRSPVYTLFVTSLNGLSTIRAFKAENHFIQLISKKIDMNTSAYILVQAVMQSGALIITFVSLLILFATTFITILFRNDIYPSVAALSVMSAISVSYLLQWTFRKVVEANILMTSGERIAVYSHLPPEEKESEHKTLVKLAPNWPTHGTIEFRNYSLRHRSNLEYAIKNINLHIESGQKVGIIGRTGAGKSSLFKGILRFVDRSNVDGQILIDGVDINCISLNDLRSHLTVISQQTILFSGTLRYNLDPFNYYSDEQYWKALEDVQLKEFVSSHPKGLLMDISESGNNLSVGQCQLITIARAILKKSEILLIDEGTANIDKETDDLIQAIFTEKFQNRTVLTIAHRLSTIEQHDRIIVLDKGIITNDDTSANILRSYC